MNNQLILSMRSYNWIDNTAGTILVEPGNWSVMIILKDDDIPISKYDGLCRNAIYEQRKHDLFRIGKRLGIRKLMNLNYTTINLSKLIMQLQLYIGLSNMNEVYTEYYNDSYVEALRSICSTLNTKLFIYNKDNNTKFLLVPSKRVELPINVLGIKIELNTLILDNDTLIKKGIEEFYSIKK